MHLLAWAALVQYDPIWFYPYHLFENTSIQRAFRASNLDLHWSDLIPCDSIWSTLIQFDPIWSNLIQFNPIWSILIFCIPKGKKRWIHRFTEHFAPASLSCISAGQSLVALGSKDGQIHVYESSNEFKCLRLVTILAHHTGAIHTVIFHDGKLLSGSDDMSVGIVNIMGEDSSKSKLILSKLLQAKICTKYRKHWKSYVSE